jgi:hypothetical protein
VRSFGSFANGLCTNASDLDVTCYRDDLSQSQTTQAKQEQQVQMLHLLKNHPRFEIKEEVWGARIPILKMLFDGILEVDLSFDNQEPLRNTQLLLSYTTLNRDVRSFLVAVKIWAKAAGVCGAREQHLSSYSLTLMAIYFLQVDPLIGLPCLPTWAFTGDLDIPEVAKIPFTKRFSQFDLLIRFFTFYTSEFQWGTEVVSIEAGRRTRMEDHLNLRGRWSGRLHIVDPFLSERNLNCVLGQAQERTLYEKLAKAPVLMRTGVLPFSLQAAAGPPPVGDFREAIGNSGSDTGGKGSGSGAVDTSGYANGQAATKGRSGSKQAGETSSAATTRPRKHKGGEVEPSDVESTGTGGNSDVGVSAVTSKPSTGGQEREKTPPSASSSEQAAASAQPKDQGKVPPPPPPPEDTADKVDIPTPEAPDPTSVPTTRLKWGAPPPSAIRHGGAVAEPEEEQQPVAMARPAQFHVIWQSRPRPRRVRSSAIPPSEAATP